MRGCGFESWSQLFQENFKQVLLPSLRQNTRTTIGMKRQTMTLFLMLCLCGRSLLMGENGMKRRRTFNGQITQLDKIKSMSRNRKSGTYSGVNRGH